MTVFILCLLLTVFSSNVVFAKPIKPLYKLPDQAAAQEAVGETGTILIGTAKGLFKYEGGHSALPLWTEGSVEQIVRIEVPNEDGTPGENWYFRTNEGILFSSDLETFELRNNGLPFLTIKNYENGNISFRQQVHQLKDLSINPLNPKQVVTATKDHVYFSRDGGLSWKNMGSMSMRTSGMKAVAVGSMPVSLKDGTKTNETVIFMSHPYYGLSYLKPDAAKPAWYDVTKGFEMMPTMKSPDEIADILPVVKVAEDGSPYTEIYLSQAYIPRLYKMDWPNRCGVQIYKGEEPCETFDGLTSVDNILVFSQIENIGSLNMETNQLNGNPEQLENWKECFRYAPGLANCAWIPSGYTGMGKGLCLNELWLLYPGSVNTTYGKVADGRKAVYVSAYQCRLQAGIDKFRKIIKDNNLNSLVIDMKDDYGLLRYDTKDPFVQSKAKITQYAVDLDHFISEFKKDNVYLIARIVTFKDRNLAKIGNGKYAVWNYKTNQPWLGIKEYEKIVNEETGEETRGEPIAWYDENWVDPYCQEVWEYNVAIAKELIARGFDEIQFDYIRFPTDGYNLASASYRWKSQGMDKESALVSFLRYARQNIDAPIGIDIYGANGWYRTGTRTGQDVELMAEYVDVIGPMFYPSHFENAFLNYPPYADRTYRIYYYGTYRNTVMARNRVIVRPWVQAFYLNVSYDRQFYNKEYVQKEVFGVRDGGNHGYMHWNNSGKYDMISPDITAEDQFIGTCPEADSKYRKPALGSAIMPQSHYVEPLKADDDSKTTYQRMKQRDHQDFFSPMLSFPMIKIK
ncbi:MAG: hypothetical protein IIT58_12445 [Treponema sp.]|nr:hypothetical protein [Treponema sp.]